jgi:hypothetical protein
MSAVLFPLLGVHFRACRRDQFRDVARRRLESRLFRRSAYARRDDRCGVRPRGLAARLF